MYLRHIKIAIKGIKMYKSYNFHCQFTHRDNGIIIKLKPMRLSKHILNTQIKKAFRAPNANFK